VAGVACLPCSFSLLSHQSPSILFPLTSHTILPALAPPAATRLALRLMLHAAKENAPLSTSAAAMASVKALSAPVSAAPLPALRVKKLNPDAVLPKRGSSGAAGYDLARWVNGHGWGGRRWRRGRRAQCACALGVFSSARVRVFSFSFFPTSIISSPHTPLPHISPLPAAPTSPSPPTAGPSSPPAWPSPPRPAPTPASPRAPAWRSSISSTRARASWTRITGARSASSCSTTGTPPLKVRARGGEAGVGREGGARGRRRARGPQSLQTTPPPPYHHTPPQIIIFLAPSQARGPGRPADPGAHYHAGRRGGGRPGRHGPRGWRVRVDGRGFEMME